MTSLANGMVQDLERRLDAVGWGLFFVVSGIVLLVPTLPDGTWLTSTGAIIVGLGALRAHVGLPVSAFWTSLGAGFVAVGAGAIAGLALPWLALLTIVCGIGLVAEAVIARRRDS